MEQKWNRKEQVNTTVTDVKHSGLDNQSCNDMKAEDENLWSESLKEMVEAHVENPDARGVIAAYHRKACREYAESQLQALKGEVEKLPTRHASSFGIPLESKWIEQGKVLNLITNLEDNG